MKQSCSTRLITYTVAVFYSFLILLILYKAVKWILGRIVLEKSHAMGNSFEDGMKIPLLRIPIDFTMNKWWVQDLFSTGWKIYSCCNSKCSYTQCNNSVPVLFSIIIECTLWFFYLISLKNPMPSTNIIFKVVNFKVLSNYFFQILGVCILIVCFWLRFEDGVYEWLDKLDALSFYVGVYILIFAALIIIGVAIFGCITAMAENQFFLLLVSG